MTDLAVTGGVPGQGRIGRVVIGDLLKRAAAGFPDRIAVTDGERREYGFRACAFGASRNDEGNGDRLPWP